MTAKELLLDGLSRWGIAATDEAANGIMAHLLMVREWNERINLTGITEEREMVIKHALDSAGLAAALEFEPGWSLLDVGSGAGFPGVTLQLLFPDLKVYLLETLQKRARFLEEVGRVIPGAACTVLTGRAEDLGRMAAYREQFDVVTARAVAELRVLAEYCMPFVKVGGFLAALKGPSGQEEADAAKTAVAKLGGEVERVARLELPFDQGQRQILLIRKVRQTPKEFPRKAGIPERKPL